MTGTYKLHNFVTGHYYIGAALDVFGRYTRHLKEVAKGDKPKKWQRAWTKYPELLDLDTWECLVLQEFETMEEAVALEAMLLDQHVGQNLCLNTLKTTEKGGTVTKEARSNMSAVRRGESNPFHGKKHTPETIEKMSAAQSGENNPRGMKGKTHSPEVRAKMKATIAAKRYTKAFFQWLGDLTLVSVSSEPER